MGRTFVGSAGRKTFVERAGGLACLGLAAMFAVGSGLAQTEATKAAAVLQGKLLTLPGVGLVLKTPRRDHPLTSKTTYLLHTLQDARLNNREARVEGTMRADGSFEVQKFFTVRDGKPYKVRYFCEICNVEALEPGTCVCCQQPTELQEIHVDNGK